MNVRKLKKLIKIKKLNNYQKSLLSIQLVQLNYKYGDVVSKSLINISKKLNLYIEDMTKLEPSTFIVDLQRRDIYFVEKIDKSIMYYYRSYSIEGGSCYSWDSKTNTSTFLYTAPKYSFSDNEPHGGTCTMVTHYRKALASEILKLPSEEVISKF